MQKLTNTLVDNTNPLHKMYNLYMFFIHLLLDSETNRLWNVRVATVTSAQLSTGTPMSENSNRKAREQETSNDTFFGARQLKSAGTNTTHSSDVAIRERRKNRKITIN